MVLLLTRSTTELIGEKICTHLFWIVLPVTIGVFIFLYAKIRSYYNRNLARRLLLKFESGTFASTDVPDTGYTVLTVPKTQLPGTFNSLALKLQPQVITGKNGEQIRIIVSNRESSQNVLLVIETMQEDFLATNTSLTLNYSWRRLLFFRFINDPSRDSYELRSTLYDNLREKLIIRRAAGLLTDRLQANGHSSAEAD